MVCKKYVLPLITISILLAIVCMILIGRGSISAYEGFKTYSANKTNGQANSLVMNRNNEILDNENLNDTEKTILKMLKDQMDQQSIQSDMAENDQMIYYNSLIDYFNNKDVNLSTAHMDEMVKLIHSLVRIEKESSFSKMSLDGREAAISISKRIYKLCGLKISYTLQGDILQITDNTKAFLYDRDNSNLHADLNLLGCTIVLFLWMVLLLVCIILAKKNHLRLFNDR